MAHKLHKNLRKSLKFGYLCKNFHFYYRGKVPNLSKLPTQQDLFLARNSLFFFFLFFLVYTIESVTVANLQRRCSLPFPLSLPQWGISGLHRRVTLRRALTRLGHHHRLHPIFTLQPLSHGSHGLCRWFLLLISPCLCTPCTTMIAQHTEIRTTVFSINIWGDFLSNPSKKMHSLALPLTRKKFE